MSAATESHTENLLSKSKLPTSFSFSHKGRRKIKDVIIEDFLNKSKIPSEEVSTDRILLEDRISCLYCKRFFSKDRIDKHQQVCETIHRKQEFLKKTSPKQSKSTRPAQAEFHYPNSRWQKQHIDLINKLRLNSCGDYEEYINCPYCSRRFAPGPAEKHINKCKDIIHKPRPPPSKILPDLKKRYNSFIQEELKEITSEKNSPKPEPSQNEGGVTERVVREESLQQISMLKKIKMKHLTEPRSKSIYKMNNGVCKCGEVLPSRAVYCMICGVCRYK